MFKKKLCFLPILFLLLVCLVGCNNTDDNINDNPSEKTGEATAYGIVHKGYIGKATVKIKDNKVVDVEIDEAFLPHNWANVDYTLEECSALPEDLLHHTKDDTSSFFAKYLSIDGQMFTGNIRENDLVLDNTTYSSQVVNYGNDKIPDLFSYLYNSDKNGEWYYNAVKSGKVFISDKEGKKLDTYQSLHAAGWLKSEGNYWPATKDSPLGWKGNIDALENYLKGKELKDLDSSKFVKDTEGVEKDGYNYKYWTIDGTKTMVTMTDVYAYYKLAYAAYTKAKANVK